MTKQAQKEFLHTAKDALGCTWIELATLTGITPLALKNYCLPSDSKDHRLLNDLARNSVVRLLQDRKIKVGSLDISEKEFTCKFCGLPSAIEPSEQCASPDYCHESDHE